MTKIERLTLLKKMAGNAYPLMMVMMTAQDLGEWHDAAIILGTALEMMTEELYQSNPEDVGFVDGHREVVPNALIKTGWERFNQIQGELVSEAVTSAVASAMVGSLGGAKN